MEILEPPTTTTVKLKPDTAFNCFNTYITWAEKKGISAKVIIILQNMRQKVFKQILQVAQKQTLRTILKLQLVVRYATIIQKNNV